MLTFEKEIAKYYKQFLDHVKDFGFGMIVLPSLVKQFKGAYFIERFTSNEASRDGQSSKKDTAKNLIQTTLRARRR